MTLTKNGDKLPKCPECGSTVSKKIVDNTYECSTCRKTYSFNLSMDVSPKCGSCCGGCKKD